MVRVENLHVRVGTFELKQIQFEIGRGQYAMLMGQTGSGKTTVLETICGLREVLSGRIWLNAREVTRLKPAERNIGFVPQDGALFTTKDVRRQLGFALVIRGWNRKAIEHRVQELAEMLGIEKLLNRMPQGLSGGERQRVALGRALAARPDVLCLDEPLSALDEKTRDGMYELLKTVTRHAGVTTLHITHSRREAEQLGDLLLRMEDGTVQRVDPPEEASSGDS